MTRAGTHRATQEAAMRAPSDSAEDDPAASRWTVAMTGFMRGLSILWILKGLSAWAIILGIWVPVGPFEGRSNGYQSTIVYFALIDLIAAVGLWMVSTWGGMMWLLAVLSHLILAAFFPAIISSGTMTMAVLLTLVAVYLAVSWLAARG